MKIVLATAGFFLALTAGTVGAAPDDANKYCAIAGYADGLGDFFISSLADKKSQQLLSNPADRGGCAESYAKASALGRKNKWLVRKGRLTNPPEVDQHYSEFSSRIEEGILKAAGY